jgi:hypothetical protein
MKLYVILDDQSNRSLGRKVLFDTFDPEANCNSYRLSTCNGHETAIGRRSSGFIIVALTKLASCIILQCRELLHVPHLMTSLQSFATCFPLTHLKQWPCFINNLRRSFKGFELNILTVLGIAELCMMLVSLKLQFAMTGWTMAGRHIMLTLSVLKFVAKSLAVSHVRKSC